MPDASESLRETTPDRLARLLRLDDDDDPVGQWRVNELGAILRHQLDSPLTPDLAVPNRSEKSIRTFGDLLQHPHPPLRSLTLLKDFAKAQCHHPRGVLPPEVMTVLYYASIVAARLHAHQRITGLSDHELCSGIASLMDQSWLEEDTRTLLTEGLAELRMED